MANVKNFGLIGVSSDVQFGKAGPRLAQTGGVFQLKSSNLSVDAGLTAAGITSSAGNVTLTTGNLVLSSAAGTVGINGDTTLSRQQAGVYQFNGTGAFIAPVGDAAARPGTAATGMIRVNNAVPATSLMEYYNGTAWTTLATGGTAVTSVTGTTDRITSTGGLTPVIDIASTYVGQSSITTLGTVTTGTWNADVIGSTYGGTGVNNGASTITLGGSLTTAGAFDSTFTMTAATAVTFPTSGTLLSTDNIAANAVTSIDFTGTGLTPATASNGVVTVAGTLDADNGGTGLAAFGLGTVLYASAADVWSAAAPGATSGVQAWDADLDALAALGTTGFIVRDGAGTAVTRSLTESAGRITITNQDGISGAPTFDLATVTDAGTGTFVKITRDTYGRVEGTTPVVAADITALVDSTYVNVIGDTMTGDLNMGTNFVIMNNAPTTDTQGANKAYVDSVATGLSWKQAVIAATTVDITLSGAQTIDGVAVVAGNRVLVRAQTLPADNGIYLVAAGAWTRTLDADTPAELDGAAVFVQQGTLYSDSGWTQTATIVTVGTTAQAWSQFSGASTYTWGVGLQETGNTININMGAGIVALPSDEVGIDLVAGRAIQLTSVLTGGQLDFVLDTGSGLEQSATGLKIAALGVTNAMLTNSAITLDANTGSGSVALGGTLDIEGVAGQGISASVAGSVVTITAADATVAAKGVASFDTANFEVTAGAVSIKAGGVDLTAEVSGILPSANGGTGVNNGASLLTLGGSLTTAGAFDSTFTMTGATAVTFPTSGVLATVGGTVASFSGGTTGLTPNTPTTGDITLGGTLIVANGGTGVATLGADQVMVGNGTGAVLTSANLAFNTSTLTVGGAAPLTLNGATATLASTTANGNINLVPNGTGSVVIGPAGSGQIASDVAEPLLVTGTTVLTLASGNGDIVMSLAGTTANKVSISGPTAAEYATGLAANDLVNKEYVDTVAGSATGDIKGITATISLATAQTLNIGDLLPVGATVLKVKVNVTAADTGTGTLSILGGAVTYMATGENDTQATGIYVAETMAVVTTAQTTAVIGGTPAGAGSATIFVEYQIV
jgi:hypothetical protein